MLKSACPGLFTNPVVGAGAVLVEPDAAGPHGATAVLVPVAVLAPSVPVAGERGKEERKEKKKKKREREKEKIKRAPQWQSSPRNRGKFYFKGRSLMKSSILHPRKCFCFVLLCHQQEKILP